MGLGAGFSNTQVSVRAARDGPGTIVAGGCHRTLGPSTSTIFGIVSRVPQRFVSNESYVHELQQVRWVSHNIGCAPIREIKATSRNVMKNIFSNLANVCRNHCEYLHKLRAHVVELQKADSHL